MPGSFDDIKARYVATFYEKENALREAWGNRDISSLQQLLHKLCGSSGSYGFDNLSSLCRTALRLSEKRVLSDDEINETLKELYAEFKFKPKL